MDFVWIGLVVVSLLLNVLLSSLAFWGLYGFFPRQGVRGDNPASWLILAIWFGFLGVFLHSSANGALLVGTSPDLHGSIAYAAVLSDAIWNAIACVSIYLHFYARYKSIPDEEQTIWSPLLMGFYPDLTHWAVKTGKRMQALYRRN